LDTRVLIINDNSSSGSQGLHIPMHDGFRLFATQNPGTGYFKGKREVLSKSFLTRFVPVVFKDMPRDEWVQVVNAKLMEVGLTDSFTWATCIVDFHSRFQEMVASDKAPFKERASYSEVSIRELIKVVNHVKWHVLNRQWPVVADAAATETAFHLLSSISWCVYGARFRHQGAEGVRALLSSMGWPKVDDPASSWSLSAEELVLDGVRVTRCSRNVGEDMDQLLSATALSPGRVEVCMAVHRAASCVLLTKGFIDAHGLYFLDASWALCVVEKAERGTLPDEQEFCCALVASYVVRVRSAEGRAELLRGVVSLGGRILEALRHFQVDSLLSRHRGEVGHLAGSCMPMAVTPRVLELWKTLCMALNVADPLLVAGESGCGKSVSVRALALLLGHITQQVLLTSESDPSELVGQLNPSEGGANVVEWCDGSVTTAFTAGDGQWCILENFNEADPCVLERLNPLLENPSVWILSEKGDVEALPVKPQFRAIATMSIPAVPSTMNKELSPALSNRFSVAVMQNVSAGSNSVWAHRELETVARVLCGGSCAAPAGDEAKIVHFFAGLWGYVAGVGSASLLTFRTFCRTVDCMYKLKVRFPDLVATPNGLVAGAVFVAIRGQMTDKFARDALDSQAEEAFGAGCYEAVKAALQPLCVGTADHVLTSSREELALYITACVLCDYAALLEGPAAVGKTSLVLALSKVYRGGLRSDGKPRQLQRVNNTASTTVQDYLGTFIPSGDSFVFQQGALYRAMVQGDFFLADEFNLADPAVMSTLFPILEGGKSIRIPGTSKTVVAVEGFRFFATQNDARYANRNLLPLTLRNRFVEMQVGEFTEAELGEIILKRVDVLPRNLASLNADFPPSYDVTSVAGTLAKVYRVMNSKGLIKPPLTMREVVKWIRRFNIVRSGQYAVMPDQRLWVASGLSLLAPRVDESRRGELASLLCTEFRVDECFLVDVAEPIALLDKEVRFRQGEAMVSFPVGSDRGQVNLAQSPLFGVDILRGRLLFSPPLSFQRALVQVVFATRACEPVLLVGPSCYKSLLVDTWCRIFGSHSALLRVHLTPETESPDLIGQMHPYSLRTALLRIVGTGEQMLTRSAAVRLTCRGRAGTRAVVGLESRLKALLVDAVSKIEAGMDAVGVAVAVDASSLERSEVEQTLTFDAEVVALDAAMMASPTYEPTSPEGIDWASGDQSASDAPPRNVTHQDPDTLSATAFLFRDVGAHEHSPREMDEYRGHHGEPPKGCPRDPYGYSQPSSHGDDAFEAFSYDEGDGWAGASDLNQYELEDEDHRADPRALSAPASSGFVEPPVLSNTSVAISTLMPSATEMQRSTAAPPVSAPLAPPSQPLMSKCSSGGFPDTVAGTVRATLEGGSLPATVIDAVSKVVQAAEGFVAELSSVCTDGAVCQMLEFMRRTWGDIRARERGPPRTLFLFRDGPLTAAAKHACPVLLEDLDQPSQAVVERANSLLEPNPSFFLTEDLALAGDAVVPLLSGFQVFATVHRSSPSQQLGLSSATRSRFTEISVVPYSDDELMAVLLFELRRQVNPTDAPWCQRALFQAYTSLRIVATKQRSISRGKCEPHHLLRCVDFLGSQSGMDAPLNQRVLVAVKVFLVEPLQLSSPTGWAESFWHDFQAKEGIVCSDVEIGMVRGLFDDPSDEQCSRLFDVVGGEIASRRQALRCVYTGVSAVPRPCVSEAVDGGAPLSESEAPAGGAGGPTRVHGPTLTRLGVLSRMRCAATKMFVKNVARILAASAYRLPFLRCVSLRCFVCSMDMWRVMQFRTLC
jgi:MoxR-like ATPase